MNKYIGIDDDWGIVGYGFNCEHCGRWNMCFAFGDEEEMECEHCGEENKMEVVE